MSGTLTEGALPLSSLRLLVSPLQLMSAALWGIVQHRAVRHYGLLEDFITALHDSIPGILTHRERVHISLGLRAKVVLEMCNSEDLCYRQNLEPHLKKIEDLIMELADEESQSKMNASFAIFSKVIYSLLDDPHEKDMFYQKMFPSEFDLKFDSSMQTLVRKLLLHLENLLPVPSLDQTSLWLGLSPSVLKECEDILNEPEPLNDLIQQHKHNCIFSTEHYVQDIFPGPPDLQTESKATHLQSSDTQGDESQAVTVKTEGDVPSVEVSLSYEVDDDEEYYNTDVPHAYQRESVGKKSFRCSTCGLNFDNLSLLSRHSISGCSGDCIKDIAITQVNLESHILREETECVSIDSDADPKDNVHSDDIVCLLCGQVYTHKTLLEHQKVCVVRYEQEKRAAAQSDPFEQHMCKRSRRVKTCSKCGQAFTSSDALTSHMRAHTEELFDNYENDELHHENGYKERNETLRDVDYTQMYSDQKCMKQCVVVLKRISSSSEISQDKTSMFSSEEFLKNNFGKCQKQISLKHLKMPLTNDDVYSNLIPPCDFNSLANITKNNTDTNSDSGRESENSTSPKPMKCTLCDQTFFKILLMKRHYFNVHRVKGSYQCPSCKRSFVRLCDMVKHHQNIRLLECDTCKKCFTNLTLLKKHKAQYNNTCATPHICETCGKACLNAGVLKHHRNAHKIKNEQAVCSYCGKKFYSKFTLQVHMNRHTGGFPCPICPKVFYKYTYLTRHMNRHNGQEPYLCEICGQGWPTPAYLDKHMVTHTEERPFKCDQCGKTYKRQCVLVTHIRSKHLGLRPFVCSVCGKAYKFSNTLKEHMIKHTGINPHKCSRCGKGFGRRYYLKKHRETKCL